MKWFLDLTTRGKLLACFSLMFVLFAAVIAAAVERDTEALKETAP